MNHESRITPQFLIFLGSSTSNKPSDKRGSHTNQTPKRRAPKPGSATVDWRTLTSLVSVQGSLWRNAAGFQVKLFLVYPKSHRIIHQHSSF